MSQALSNIVAWRTNLSPTYYGIDIDQFFKAFQFAKGFVELNATCIKNSLAAVKTKRG